MEESINFLVVIQSRIRISGNFSKCPPLTPSQNIALNDIYWHFSYNHRPLLTKLGRMTDADNGINLLHFGSDPTDSRILINLINQEIPIRIPEHVRLRQS